MNDKNSVIILKIIGILIIFLIGASFGANFSDNNWKKDINKVSNTQMRLIFDNSGYAYSINKINLMDNNNNSFYDVWNTYNINRNVKK